MPDPLPIARSAHAAGSETIRIGFVGCGNRGTGACREALLHQGPGETGGHGRPVCPSAWRPASEPLKYEDLAAADRRARRAEVRRLRRLPAGDRGGRGPGALATPPHFRPMHYAAAVRGRQARFLEKPLCVDAPGYRTLLAANAEARRKKLSVVVGLQRRHQQNYLDGIRQDPRRRRGRSPLIRTYFNMPGGGRGGPAQARRAWARWNTRSATGASSAGSRGDHFVEQATHLIDVANWVMDGPPLSANGHGRPRGPQGTGQRRHLGPSCRGVRVRRRRPPFLPGPAAARHLGPRLRQRARHPGLAHHWHRSPGAWAR